MRLLKTMVVTLVASTAIGILLTVPASLGEGMRRPILPMLMSFVAWGLLAPLVELADERLPIAGAEMQKRLLAHVPLSLLFTAASMYVIAALRAALGADPWSNVVNPRLIPMTLTGFFPWSWLMYWLVAGSFLIKRYYGQFRTSELRAAHMERLFSEARLNALRMQLDPHFLFNALHTISSQVDSNPKLARKMIENLGDLLRFSLATKDQQEVALAEEMRSLEHYLAIQRIRFGDRLTLETSIADDAADALVPCLIVQPLVENAIRHGISHRASGGTVQVSAHRENGYLRLQVSDDGVGLPPEWDIESSSGLGLSVTRQRIAAVADKGQFAVRARAEGGTEVEIRLPYREGSKR